MQSRSVVPLLLIGIFSFNFYSVGHASPACADNLGKPSISGSFSFMGQINSLGSVDRRMINVRKPDGQKELLDLQNNGFACELVTSDTYRCRKNQIKPILPENVSGRAIREHQNLSIDFTKPNISVELKNNSPGLKEWEVVQYASFQGINYYRFLVRESGQGMTKLVLVDDDGRSTQEFVQQSCKHLDLVRTYKSGSTEYVVAVALEKL